MTKTMGLVVAIALLAGTTVARAEETAIAKTTAAGQPVKVRNHVKIGNGCAGAPPNISFNTKPAHGSVEIKPDRFVLGKGYGLGNAETCAGQQVDGVALWYTPAAGFHGVDQFSWTTDFGGNGRHARVDNYAATITVQ